MKAKNWKKINEILQDVLEIESSARQKYLDETNVSGEIRAEVESLLAFENESEDFMSLSANDFSNDFISSDEIFAESPVGQKIGIYEIVRELGYGGMGAVYLAERADGKFEQKVALKLLKREMNTAALRRRFQQEREILASLEHPNIARLLDAGTTDDKIPYLAMEYVEGLPIDDFCNKHKLNLEQRLDLFREVCAAVNFAHRNLIVHRDLKPSNILVNEDGVPKLLDFGISKILSTEFEQLNVATVTKMGAMTPSYASPEQLQNKSVTTATDIYSLGVVLYELLSGHRPFETKEDDLKEIYKAVIEIDPPPPSVLVETVSRNFKEITDAETQIKSPENAKSEIDKPHRTEANKMRLTHPQTVNLSSNSLRGDLDNIVLKALRKEPERRYSSAENFSEDIKRHLKGLPVTARPNTFSYRAEKFFRRNRASAIAGILILLAIIGGIVATLWQARVAQAERAKAEVERAKAEKRFGDVRKLANSYLFDVFPEIEDLEGALKARGIIVKTALEYLNNLSQEAEGDLDLQLELATAYEKIGEIQGAVNITNLGDINAGLESYEKARKLRESVFAANPADLKNKENLSKNYAITAQTLQWNIDTAKAAEYFEKAIKIRRELVAEKPDSPDYQNRLAVLLTDYAAIPLANVENEKAAKLLDESAAIIKGVLKNNPEHFYTRKAYPRVLRADSQLKSNTGDYDGAIKDIDESVVLTDALIKEKPEDYSLQRTAFVNDFYYCEIYIARRDGQKVLESCRKTIDFNVKELEKEPDDSYAIYDLAVNYYDIAQGYNLSNNPRQTIEYAQKSLELMAKLDKIAPGTNEYLRIIAVVEKEIADAQLSLGQPEKALTNLTNAQTKLEKVVETDKSVTGYQVDLANVYRSMAIALNKNGEKSKAVEFADKAISIVQRLNESNSLKESDKNLLTELKTEKVKYNK
ncbi:MAG: protein kinase domain-containing protein [Pyrinomonadaceae bacterium]